MWFNICRLIIFLVPIFFLLARRRKLAKTGKKINAMAIIVCVLLWLSSTFIPVENLFIDFPSPEAVFNYCRIGNIINVIPGQESSMVIYSDGNSNDMNPYFVARSGDKYKINLASSSYAIYHGFNDENFIIIYRYPNSQDNFIYITYLTNDKERTISDEIGTEFNKVIVKIPYQKYSSYYYFGYVHDLKAGYCLYVDNSKIVINYIE